MQKNIIMSSIKDKVVEKLAGEAIAQTPTHFELQYVGKVKGWHTLGMSIRVKRTRKVPLHPASFRKMALISSLVLQMDINEEKMKAAPVKEAMRIISRQSGVVIRIIALATAEDKTEYNNEEWIQRRIELLEDKLSAEAATQLLMWILLAGDFINFANTIGWIIRVSVTTPKATPIVTPQ